MEPTDKPLHELITDLKERAKELNCLYGVDETLSLRDQPQEEILRRLVQVIPPGWQYPEICVATITVGDEVYRPEGFTGSAWCIRAEIVVEGERAGEVAVYYTEPRPKAGEGPFLKEEARLIRAIANRIGNFLMQSRVRQVHEAWQGAVETMEGESRREWHVLLDFLRRTDSALVFRIGRKMVNHLYWSGVPEVRGLLQAYLPAADTEEGADTDENRPRRRWTPRETGALIDKTFDLASEVLEEGEIIRLIQAWMKEEKSAALMEVLESPETGLAEVKEALESFVIEVDEEELPPAVRTSLRVSLLRRCFSDRLEFINAAKEWVRVKDFNRLLSSLVYPGRSQGKLGGKSAGLFLAQRVLERSGLTGDPFPFRAPRTWHVTSDALIEFIRHNDLEDLYNRKYQDLEQIRQDYPYVVQLFKNSAFPPELTKALSAVLDDSEAWPLIVRSSSLLEDRAGSAFSGKYKSLFLANQGTKQERLIALQDAVAEVYASVFSPDPIQYRVERRLLDVNEEMAVMIQEVVGKRTGPYFFPAFSGVAFSNSEFRWSPRIRRQDGLLRMVPGLGTRAVDRLTDDYPVLVSPGQPGLRVNVSPDEVIRYAPRRMDLIDLRENCFRTVEIKDILRDHGHEYPVASKLISVVRPHGLEQPGGLGPRWDEDELVVTFEGLLQNSGFLGRMKTLLDVLSAALGSPVDIEFACDGESFYLLQCRPQSYGPERAPAAIPRNLPRERLIFTANRHVMNGVIEDIRYIVYVDPEAYAALSDPRRNREVGHLIGKLNKLLPRKQFILMGPGRWGSRGDIRLGVPVTYSDLSNTAMLVEIARRQGNYVPELSFGTHFFQDLVEAEIRYLPLYPDEPEIVFNEPFLRRGASVLQDLVPVSPEMAETVRVIDIARETGGLLLRVLMNQDLEEAVGILARSGEESARADWKSRITESESEDHSSWRWQMAERIAAQLDPGRFGVRALYVYGSTKNWVAGPGSDIDLIIHDGGDPAHRQELTLWLEGWSRALAEQNYLRTGYRSAGLLDLHFVTDADIAAGTSLAAKIGAVTDGARALPLKDAAGLSAT